MVRESIRDDTWNATTRGDVWYNFDLGCLKPFVGASLGYLYGDNSNTRNDLMWSPRMDIHDIIESHYDYVRNKLNGN